MPLHPHVDNLSRVLCESNLLVITPFEASVDLLHNKAESHQRLTPCSEMGCKCTFCSSATSARRFSI